MPLTRVSLESTTVDYLVTWLARVGLSTVTDGTNPAVNGRIVETMEAFGYAVADPTNVTDDDLAAVPDSQARRFRWHVIYYTYLLVEFRFAGSGGNITSFTAGNTSQTFKDLGADLSRLLKLILAELDRAGGLIARPAGSVSGLIRAGRCRSSDSRGRLA